MIIQDTTTWNKIITNGNGYIYNDFGTQFPGNAPSWNTRENNKLHRANCPHIIKMKIVSDKKVNKHFFESKASAIEWLKANRKTQGYSLCLTCRP